MAFKTISVLLTANASSLRQQLLLASRDIDAFGARIDGVSKSGVSSSQLLAAGFGAAGIAVAVGLVAANKAATEFEGRMRNVNSISGLSEQQLGALSGRVLDLSRQLPQSANTLAEGLYEVASSGFQGAAGLEVLEKSAIAASAGLTTTQNSAKAITAVLNAYGLSASDAGDVSDALFQTVNLGVINFEELTGVIGDVVGTAAAAKVDIGQVGAALATMTLSGISASEAGTSLNRVLQSIIKPSDALGVTLNHLGYESGSQALAADGLRGVMEKLRVSTGGNVDAFLALFPEIRAARGAFALAAADGATYARVTEGIADKNDRAGATAKAFNEQMKGLGLQLKVFMNWINAGLIQGGTPLLGFLKDALVAVQDLARSGLPGLQGGLVALAPFFHNVAQAGGDVVDIAKALVDSLSPVEKALAGIVAGGVIQSLNVLSTALADITGFLADHEDLVTAAAIAYGISLAPAIAATAVSLGVLGLATIAQGLQAVTAGAQTAAGAFTTLAGATALVGTLGAVLAITAAVSGLRNAKGAADKLYQSLAQGLDLTSMADLNTLITRITNQRQAITDTGDAAGGWARAFGNAAQLGSTLPNTIADAREAMETLDEKAGAAARTLINLGDNINMIRNVTGQSEDGVLAMAKALGVDLTRAYVDNQPARDKIVQHFRDVATTALGGGEALVHAAEISVPELERMAKEVSDLTDAVAKAFSGATDLVSGFAKAAGEQEKATGGLTAAQEKLAGARQDLADLEARRNDKETTADTKALTKAQDALATATEKESKARQNLADLEARQDGTETVAQVQALRKAQEKVADATNDVVTATADLTQARAAGSSTNSDTVAGAQALRDAQNKVAEATAGVTKAQGELGDTSMEAFFQKTLADAESFANGIQIATAKGLDPALIIKLLKAGPEAAAPFLQAIAADHSGKLVDLANKTEEKLSEINVKVIAFARLTQQAVNSLDDQKVKDLGLAMLITASNMEESGGRTATAIANDINAPLTEVDRVAKSFGITLASLPTDLKIKVKYEFPAPGDVAPKDVFTGTLPGGVTVKADGGIVRYYAGGGFEQHVAQISPAGVTRIWAEPETGGEAYIPMSAAKRGRSSQILASVASEFGYHLVPRRRGEVQAYGNGSSIAGGMLTIDYARLAAELRKAPIEVPVYLNGREIARAATPDISREMTNRSRARQ